MFVPGGATLELTAALSSTALALSADETPDSVSTPAVQDSTRRPPPRSAGAAVRVFGKERIPGTRILVDGTLNTLVWSSSLIPVTPGRQYVLTAQAPGHLPDTFRVTNAAPGDTLTWQLSLTPVEATTPPEQRFSDSFESPQRAVEAFLAALRAAGLDGIRQVWTSASDSQLQPWRTLLQGARVQSAALGDLPPPTGDNAVPEYYPVNVAFSFESTTGEAAPRSGIRRLRVVLYLDGGRWKISSVALQ
jgi:hypothetical protein